MKFELSQRSSNRMHLRHLYENYTCLPSGTPTEWDKKLKQFDPELFLRFSYISRNFLIFYDHNNTLSVIRSFGQNESFGKAFANVRHNSTLNTRVLIQMRKDLDDAENKRQRYDIDQCGEEMGIELHHATRRRVINDSVDAFAPEKPSLGGVIL